MADFTTETRIARLREWANAKYATASAQTLKPGSNIIFGAAIHGMARRSKGAKDLTELEEMGIKFFDLLAESEEELKAYSEICVEAKSIARSGAFVAANIPRSIMSLSEDTPYANENFMEDVKKLAVETILQPHIRAVTPEQIQADGTIDTTEEYTSASTELKREVTVFCCSEEEEGRARKESVERGILAPISMKIEPYEFICRKKSGEVGKDEVYFTWGFGSDRRQEVAHRTPEFGSVKNGVVRQFPRSPPVYRGQVDKGCAGHIVCWEADHSNSEWYNKLIQTMWAVAENSSKLALSVGDANWDFLIGLIPGPIGNMAEVAMWLENIATFIAAFLEIFRNKDDKVKENSYAFSRQWLSRAVPGHQQVGWEFNGGGGGHHFVVVQFLPY